MNWSCPICRQHHDTTACPTGGTSVAAAWVTPDPKPHKCPVCDGQGLVSRPPHVAGDASSWYDSAITPYACRACEGKGVLWR